MVFCLNLRRYSASKRISLNTAYLCTTLGDRMWTFAIGVFMHKLGGITWVALQQLADASIKLIFFPLIGPIIDRQDRNRTMQIALRVNNLAVMVSAILFGACFFAFNQETNRLNGFGIVALLGAIFFAAVSRLASETQRTAFSKDWVVVICNASDSDTSLSTHNAQLTIIDQVSSVVLPFATGVMFEFLGWIWSCVVIVLYNAVSWLIEQKILTHLYESTPSLATRSLEHTQNEGTGEETKVPWINSLKLYYRQSSFLAAFGLALLYMTVLGFDNLAGSYGQKHGMSLATLGVLRTCGSGLGILGAVAYSYLEKAVGLSWTALIGLSLQNVFIDISGFSTTLPSSPMNVTGYYQAITFSKWWSSTLTQLSTPGNTDTAPVSFFELPPSIIVFFFGITLARFGLWIADPAITQIMQTTIPESERYTVFSIQSALCEAFSLIKDALVILFSETELFGALAILSCVFVFAGYACYIVYFLKEKLNPTPIHAEPTETEMREVRVINRDERESLLTVHGDESTKADTLNQTVVVATIENEDNGDHNTHTNGFITNGHLETKEHTANGKEDH